MSTPIPPRTPPRFLPTLTEVVQLSAAAPAAASPAINADDLIDRVMLRLDGPLQAALQSAIGAVVIDKLREMEPRIRDEVDRAVRHAVEEAIAAEIGTPQTSQGLSG